MNNFDRNTRTLIVSFLIAIFALIPLRFIEAGEQQNMMFDAQVLGESTSVLEETAAAEVKPAVMLEAPYDQIEKCKSREDVLKKESEVAGILQRNGVSGVGIENVLREMRSAETNLCK